MFTHNICFASAMGGYDAGSINSQYMRDLRIHEMATRERSKNAIIKKVKYIGAEAPTAAKAFSPISLPTIKISAS